MDENRMRPACALRQTTRSNTAMTDLPAAPVAEWIYTAEVDIAEPRDLGPARGGHRYLVDILGGRFEGPRLRGMVLRGGVFVLN